MTAPQTPQPLPEPGRVMTPTQYKRFTAAHYKALAAQAAVESKQQ